jgi:hypothetical protein
MSKNRYDFLTALAVIVLVVSTLATQHFPHAGYAFGIVAVLAALGSFAIYVKALPKRVSHVQGQILTQHLAVPQFDAVTAKSTESADVDEPRYSSHDYGSLVHWKIAGALSTKVDAGIYKEALERYLGHDLYKASALRVVDYLRVAESSRVHLDPRSDPATLIANVVEKLCATTNDPQFEFIISPDGTFKIQQISAKRNVGELHPSTRKPEDSASTMIN